MNKKLVIKSDTKYDFCKHLYLENREELIFSSFSAEKFKTKIKDFIDEYQKHIYCKVKKDKLILDNYEIVELIFEDTEEEENTKNIELVNIDLIPNAYQLDFILEIG